jgi:hypothetical protein
MSRTAGPSPLSQAGSKHGGLSEAKPAPGPLGVERGTEGSSARQKLGGASAPWELTLLPPVPLRIESTKVGAGCESLPGP